MREIVGIVWFITSLYVMIFVPMSYPGMFKYVMLFFMVGTISAMAGFAYTVGAFNEPPKQ